MALDTFRGSDAHAGGRNMDQKIADYLTRVDANIRKTNSDVLLPTTSDEEGNRQNSFPTANNDSVEPVTPDSNQEQFGDQSNQDNAPEAKTDAAIASDAKPESNSGDIEITATKSQIDALIAAKVEEARQDALKEARKEAQVDKVVRARLEDVFAFGSTKGNTHPVNADSQGFGGGKSSNQFKTVGGSTLTVLGEGSPKMREFDQLATRIMKDGYRVTDRSMNVSIQRDTRRLDAFYRKHRKEINDGLEAMVRNLGLLQGANTRVASDAISSVTDIPSVMFEVLSSFIRTNQYADLIHWQFATTEYRAGVEVGMQMKIPRYNYLPRPSSRSERELTQGVRITANSTPVTQDNRLVTIKELGRGKANTAGAEPIGFSTFVEAFSMADLEGIIEVNLGYDYAYTKDLFLRGELFRTDYVVYNNNGNVATNPAFAVGSDRPSGIITEAFINNLVAEAYSLEIAPFRDGCYGLLLNPKAWAQYMNDKSQKERDNALMDVDLVTAAVRRRTDAETYGGQVSGYCGTFNGVHIFKQNVYGKGNVAGTDEGVQTTAFSGGNQTTRTSFLIGRETIGWGTALPAEIRFDEVDDFRRERRAIWYSHENSASLDVKNTPSTIDPSRNEEQLRVIEIRSTENPLPVAA